MKKNQSRLLSLVLSLLMLFSMAACNNTKKDDSNKTTKPQVTQTTETKKAVKQINLTVVYADKSKKEFKIETTKENLRQALEQEKLISGTESKEYGLMIKTVDGYTADDSKQEWWQITKDGEFLNTGVDSTPIKSGDNFELTLVVGY
ncbi:MAG: DUF4430 domain-containing protein [Acutalibacteraceae bacterium]|jgi:hypothetical protein